MNRLLLPFLLLALSASATGILLPKDQSLPALAIKHQRVNVDIDDGVATATIDQVFQNNVNRVLEATYIFPLPKGAAIGDFAMYINGKRESGELVEKDKARKIYQDIVRRMKDPGLLEYMDGELLKVSVYPVPANGEQRIEVSYSEQLAFESGIYKFTYPLRTGEAASQTLEDFTVGVKLKSKTALKNIYSPSHKVGISRKGEHEAVIGFEEMRSTLDRDFVLYYGVSAKQFGLNLLTYKTKDQDGYFMMMLAPNVKPPKNAIVARDIVFVFDTSGSMAGKKIDQAREALRYCVNKINKKDRFNIVRFSTDAETFADGLVGVDKRDDALAFIDKMEARGGTAIHDALSTALAQRTEDKRSFNIVFLTDGKPTIGETDIETIVKAAVPKDSATRIFVFGVGDEVNTHLLDRIANDSHGLSLYVKPTEDIETEVSAFYNKVSHPVLTNPSLTVENLKILDVYPKTLPDLFRGSQLTIFGRYKKAGDFAVRLKGEVNGQEREYVYEQAFTADSIEHAFIPRLWATRKVGYLLDEIRLKGEVAELKDEVVRLSKEHGIMTPYTSYLVLEDDAAYSRNNIPRDRRELASAEGRGYANQNQVAPAAATPQAEQELLAKRGHTRARAGADRADYFAYDAGAAFEAEEATLSLDFNASTGRQAVVASEAIARYKANASTADSLVADSFKAVGDKQFQLLRGAWVDSSYKDGMKSVHIEWGSEAYFALLDKLPELIPYFALGQKLTVVHEGTAYIVSAP
jgi:Ca-activated chloride channel family protein